MRNFGEVLSQLRQERNISQRALSEQFGMSHSTIGMYENGQRQPNFDTLEQIADYFNVDMNYLLGKTLVRNSYREVTGHTIDYSVTKIPVLGAVPCGVPITAIEYILDWEEIDEAMARRGTYYGLRATGDSMYPKIENGDTLIVKQVSNIDSGKIAIVKINGEDATCKKVLINDTGITIIPLNVSYDPVHYSQEDVKELPITICGEVVEIRRKL